jgi:hypothetical protein
MTERVRVIDPQAVEAAEFARKNNKVVVAAEMASIGLGLPFSPLTWEEVSKIASDRKQSAVLACLSRIYVDSLKTAANQSKLPSQALPPLERSAWAINTIYRNTDFKSAVSGLEKDHRGRQHNFGAEMPRDEAKVLFAASYLYEPERSNNLIVLGEKILQDTYKTLPDNHPTKPLIGIELQLSRASRGVEVDTGILLNDFESIVRSDERTNPHRVATVASWLAVWGDKLRNDDMKNAGFEVFGRIVNSHPEWAFMMENERKKQVFGELRRILFRVLTPVNTKGSRRENLYSSLVGDYK